MGYQPAPRILSDSKHDGTFTSKGNEPLQNIVER